MSDSLLQQRSSVCESGQCVHVKKQFMTQSIAEVRMQK